MPKLTATQAKVIEKAKPVTTNTFQPHPPGFYVGRLEEVEARISGQGNPYWAVTWGSLRTTDGDELGGKQFANVNLPSKLKPDWKADDPKRDEKWANYQERTKGQLHAFFLAFGYTADSDTDEMIGEDCIIELGVETQAQGKNAGTLRNTVVGWLPIGEEGVATADDAADDEEDEF